MAMKSLNVDVIKLTECNDDKEFDCPKCGLPLTAKFLLFQFNQVIKFVCPKCKKTITIIDDRQEKVKID